MVATSFNGTLRLKEQAWNDKYPVQALQWIKEHSENKRIFNNYNWGGFLLYHDIPAFIDGRTDIYMLTTYNRSTIFRDYLDAHSNLDAMNRVIDGYRIDRFLLAKENQGSMIGFLMQNSQFVKTYEDQIAVIFDRK
ncbi:hypothetical protein [Paenibacillus sp. GYB003]|uniref:hypothetical protein n=1 Tax=Paenibacillus sp. GYB003 TaxID=2994392 RepID=UPI002F9609CC